MVVMLLGESLSSWTEQGLTRILQVDPHKSINLNLRWYLLNNDILRLNSHLLTMTNELHHSMQ
eukprot:m.731595 g.731595  ORF g.731595 m.731595 type:complete len:63 (+) comp23060_c0_seq14:33-221(+)